MRAFSMKLSNSRTISLRLERLLKRTIWRRSRMELSDRFIDSGKESELEVELRMDSN